VGSGEYRGPEKLILINPAGLFANEEITSAWEARFKQVMEGGYEYLRPHTFAKEPFWFRYIVPELARFVSREDVLAFMGSFRAEHNLVNSAHQIKGDVWLVWGDRDTLCNPSWAEEWMRALAQKVPDSHLMRGKTVLIKDSGHSPQIEAPMTTSAVLAQILAGRTPHKLGKRWYRVLEDRIDTRFYLKAIK
jgi:pimeloyl-ACP methyl ester carboxylesterase